jgi:hypothetical protein
VAVRAQLADARSRIAGAEGGQAPTDAEIARVAQLSAREAELVGQLQRLGVVQRDATKFTAELALVRQKLAAATSAFDGAALSGSSTSRRRWPRRSRARRPRSPPATGN